MNARTRYLECDFLGTFLLLPDLVWNIRHTVFLESPFDDVNGSHQSSS